MKPDGVFLSNGPGDPAACTYAVEATRGLQAWDIWMAIVIGHMTRCVLSVLRNRGMISSMSSK